MAIKKTNSKEKKKLQEEIIPNGCIISKSIYEKKTEIRWLYRDEAINEMDSGWRAFGNSKDKDLIIVDIDTLIKLIPITTTIISIIIKTYKPIPNAIGSQNKPKHHNQGMFIKPTPFNIHKSAVIIIVPTPMDIFICALLKDRT